jgi:hypothetical protein
VLLARGLLAGAVVVPAALALPADQTATLNHLT